MFYYLRGILKIIENNFLVIDCSGVGFKCFTTLNTQRMLSDNINKEVTIFTYLNVKEDALTLFGFSTTDELNCFKLLTSVSGVGPKAGLAILSQFSPEQVAIFISSNDSKSITKVSGIGNKIAQRIILELRDKLKLGNSISNMNNTSIVSVSKNIVEALKALEVLGYSQNDVMPILKDLDSSLPVEQLIKLVLQHKIKR